MEAAATKAGRRMMTFAGWERTLLLLTSYSAVFLASHFVAFGLRFDLAVPNTMQEPLWLG